jgi:hypothetical protein
MDFGFAVYVTKQVERFSVLITVCACEGKSIICQLFLPPASYFQLDLARKLFELPKNCKRNSWLTRRKDAFRLF